MGCGASQPQGGTSAPQAPPNNSRSVPGGPAGGAMESAMANVDQGKQIVAGLEEVASGVTAVANSDLGASVLSGLEQAADFLDKNVFNGGLMDNAFIQVCMKVVPDIAETIKTVASIAIPPPGGQVVAAAIQIAHIVFMELRNNQTCMELAQDCLKILHHLMEDKNRQALESNTNMRQAFDEFQIVARDIHTFVNDVRANQNWLLKMMNYASTQRELANFRSRMESVVNLLQLGATINTYRFLQLANEESEAIKGNIEKLKTEHRCQSVAELVKIPAARQKLAEWGHFKPENELMFNQLSDVQTKVDELAARGPWNIVHHDKMRDFWRYSFDKNDRVAWDMFWEAFPSRVDEEIETDQVKVKLVEFFSETESGKINRTMFELAVDMDDRTTVSVPEINKAFADPTESVGNHIRKLRAKVLNVDKDNLRLQVDRIPAQFVHRPEVDELANLIEQHKVVLVRGLPGEGKLTTAIAAAHELFKASKVFEVLSLDMDKDINKLPNKLARALSPVVKAQEEDQIIQAKLTELKLRGEDLKSGWPVVFIFNDCELVDPSNMGILEEKIQTMLDQVPQLHIVLCAREPLQLQGLETGLIHDYILPSMTEHAGAEIVKKLVTKEIKQEHAQQLAKNAACNPVLIRIMSGFVNRGDPIDQVLEYTVEEALGGKNKAMQAVLVKSLEGLESDLNPLVKLVDVSPVFDLTLLMKVVLKTKRLPPAHHLIDTLKGANMVVPTSEGKFAVVTLIADFVRRMIEEPKSYPTLKEHVLAALEERTETHQLYVSYVHEEVDKLFPEYLTSPLTVGDSLATLKPLIQQVLKESDKELLQQADVKSALLSIMRQIVYFPLTFDKPVIQDACVARAADWGGDPTCLAVASCFYLTKAANTDHGMKPNLERAEKVLAATASAKDDDTVLARSLALRAKGLILRDMYDQLDVAIQCHKEAIKLLQPLADKGHVQARLEVVVNLGEVAGTLDYLGKVEAYEEGLQLGGQAIERGEELFGKAVDHPITAMCMGALGYNLRGLANKQTDEKVKLAKLQEALQQHMRAYKMRNEVLKDHPETAMSLNQIALCLEDLGDLERAEEQLEKSLVIRVKCLGPRDAMVANTKEALARARLALADKLSQPGMRQTALADMKDMVSIRREALGLDHKKTKANAENLVKLLTAEGQLEEAKRIADKYLPKGPAA